MPSDTVQIISAVVSLVGTMFAGFITYLMARLKTQQESQAAINTVKVEQIQQALARVESNRTSLAVVRGILEVHGNALVEITLETAARLAAHPDPADFHAVMQHHAELLVANTKTTIAKLASLDAAEANPQ